MVDAALKCLSVALPVLDFSTIKNELFPVVAMVFSKTNSLAIKIRGLQAFVIFCGGSTSDDGMEGFGTEHKKTSSSSALDKYTMQEKIVPLIKGIKTKEPAVMMAALGVLRHVGQAVDADFVAMDILPILWGMSLNPHFNLKQFQAFMDLIKALSKRVEDEQTRKLHDLTGAADPGTAAPNEDFMGFGGVSGTSFDAPTGDDDDFERLVKGKVTDPTPAVQSWDDEPKASAARPVSTTPRQPAFAWSTPAQTPTTAAPLKQQHQTFRTVTPDLASFAALSPSTTQFSQPLQPSSAPSQAQTQSQTQAVGWQATTPGAGGGNPWASTPVVQTARPFANLQQAGGFSLPPPPGVSSPTGGMGGFGAAAPGMGGNGNAWASSGGVGQGAVARPGMGMVQSSSRPAMGSMNGAQSLNSIAGAGSMGGQNQGQGQGQSQGQSQNQGQKSGLDKYESLL